MLYLVGIEVEKISGDMKYCGRWSDVLDEIFPEIMVLTNGLGILQNILLLLLLQTLVGRRIWGWTELSSRNYQEIIKKSVYMIRCIKI